nr:hypothetical protein [Gaetbulibacter sp. 4G1]
MKYFQMILEQQTQFEASLHSVTKRMFLTLLVLLYSCNTQKTNEVESYELISILIDRHVIPIPEPPPVSLSEDEFNKRLDSIKKRMSIKPYTNKEFIVYLKPISKIGEIDNTVNDSTEVYSLSNKVYSSIKLIDTSKITVKKNIKFYNKKPLYTDDFKDIDIVLSFSEILFNSEYDKAILKLGVSRGKLSGFNSLLICEKINGKWVIISSKLLSIS